MLQVHGLSGMLSLITLVIVAVILISLQHWEVTPSKMNLGTAVTFLPVSLPLFFAGGSKQYFRRKADRFHGLIEHYPGSSDIFHSQNGTGLSSPVVQSGSCPFGDDFSHIRGGFDSVSGRDKNRDGFSGV